MLRRNLRYRVRLRARLHRILRQKLRYRLCLPRRAHRARRGLGLLDVILGIAVFSVILTWAGDMAGRWITSQATQGEARLVSRLADAGVQWTLRDHTRQQVSGVKEITLDDLGYAGLWNPATPLRTPYRRRDVTLWRWSPDPAANSDPSSGPNSGQSPNMDPLLILAVASHGGPAGAARATRGPTGTPRGGPGIDMVGAIANTAGATRLMGPGIDFDLADLRAAQPGLLRPGDMIGLRWIAPEIAVSPYLHRQAVAGAPELNRMETDLNLGGFALTGASDIETETLTITDTARIEMITGTTVVTGSLEVAGITRVEGKLTVAGDTDITGAVRADTAEVATVHTDEMRVSGAARVGETIGAAAGVFTTLNVSGGVTIETLSADTVSAGTLTVEEGCNGC